MGALMKADGLLKVHFQEGGNASGFKDAKELVNLFLLLRNLK